MDEALKTALDALKMSMSEATEAHAKALDEYRKTAEANAEKRDAAYDAKLEALQAELAKFEPLNAAMTAAEAREKELQDSIDRVEARLNRPGAGGEDVEAEVRAKAFEAYARKGMSALTGDYQNVLQVSDDEAAGVLATPEYVRSILKELEEYSPFRTLASRRTTGSRSVQYPRRTGLPEAIWVGETQTRDDTEGLKYGMLEIPVHEATMAVPISNQMLEDADFNMMDEIREAVAHSFSKQEGAAFVKGDKDGKPEGFLNASGTVAFKTGTAATITADSILQMRYGNFKDGHAQRGTYILNNKTLGIVSLMKDSEGQYIMRSGFTNGVGNTIGGRPYVVDPEMPDVGAGTKPVAFGDWKRGYTIVDRLAMEMLRDQYTRAANGQVLFRWRRRVGGAVTMAEAIAVLTVEQ